MKKRLTVLLCSLFMSGITFAQTNIFELRIEPRDAGVWATLTNLSNYVYIIPSFSQATPAQLPNTSILIPEIEMDNNDIADGMQQGFFFAESWKKKNLIINPGESYQIWVSYKERLDNESGLTGIAYPSIANKIKKVRFKLDKFKAFTVVDKKLHVIDTTLYSNWIDVESIMRLRTN